MKGYVVQWSARPTPNRKMLVRVQPSPQKQKLRYHELMASCLLSEYENHHKKACPKPNPPDGYGKKKGTKKSSPCAPERPRVSTLWVLCFILNSWSLKIRHLTENGSAIIGLIVRDIARHAMGSAKTSKQKTNRNRFVFCCTVFTILFGGNEIKTERSSLMILRGSQFRNDCPQCSEKPRTACRDHGE